MKAVLLAAGVGSRISREITTPKSMLKIKNTTIMGHTVRMLIDNNIEVAIVVGYKKDCILESLKNLPVTYYYNPFYRITNSISSLWFARDFLEGNEDIILANADVFWEQPILNTLLNDNRSIVMLSDKTRIDIGDYFFKVMEDKLVSFGNNLPLEERSAEYVGIAKLRSDFVPEYKAIMENLVDDGRYDLWWEDALYLNIAKNPVYVKDVSEFFWSEVDYIEDYRRILAYLEGRDI
jgi:choline kinase